MHIRFLIVIVTALSHWEIVIASYRYCSRHIGTVTASRSYCFEHHWKELSLFKENDVFYAITLTQI
jgi:hypothetical protein